MNLSHLVLTNAIWTINSLRPRQNKCHFADDIFKWIFLNWNELISVKISLKFIPKGQINSIPALVQIMAWHRPGDKSLSEPMMIISLMHISITQPQWVKEWVLVTFQSKYKNIILINLHSGSHFAHASVIQLCALTHWPLEIWKKVWICNFQTNFRDWWLRHHLWNCSDMNVTGLHWWSVNIGSGNGLVPLGNKPLPEPMLTQIYVAIWHH